MVDFRRSKRFETRKSLIEVDAGLPEGEYIFQLTAFDANGNKSKPARVQVVIVRQPRPTEPIRPRPINPGDPVFTEPIRPGLSNRPESLANTADNTPSRKRTVKKKTGGNKTPSKVSSKKTKRRKKSDTDNT